MYERKLIVKNQLLLMLKQNTDYISGEAISDSLGVSRSAIWKVINKLKKTKEEAPVEAPKQSAEEKILVEIREILRNNKQ